MKDKIFIITTIIFFVGLIVAGFFIFDFSSKNNELSLDNRKLEGELEDSNEDLEEALDQVDTLEEENSTQAKELTDLLTEMETLTSDFEEMSGELDELTAEHLALQEDFDFLYDLTYCEEKYYEGVDIDYSSNETVSQTLTEWWLGYRDGAEITEATWYTLWKGLDISIHNLYYNVDGTGNYKHTFFVFYDVEDYSAGVYFVYKQCWLDIQE
jgi:hypothetical protein